MEKNLKNNFRVPRKTNKEILELITDDGDQKQFLLTKVMESFKKPEISKHNMGFLQCWSIKNSEMETAYAKRRQSIKLKNQNTLEYYGFLYLKNEKDLKAFATLGKIKIGNIPDSKLACGNMGVSLSQFSDIFHPGSKNTCLPNCGILLIVKYLRGKVNYVTYDDKPMEPQPQYDCHIVRNGNNLDSNATMGRAFHSTQVFLYEYSEDYDIVEYPSQLLIIGAVSFTWSKNYIYKTNSDKPVISPKPVLKRTIPESFTHNDPIPRKISCKSLFSKLSKPNSKKEPIPLMSGNLIVMDDSSELKINVTLMSRFEEPIPLHNLLAPAWELTEVIPNHIFIEFFHYMDDKGCPSIIKVSQHNVTQLPRKFYDGKVVPKEGRSKHLVCLSMTPSCHGDRKDVTKLIDHMSKSETVGRITTQFFPNVWFFLFPSGKIADSLGIPKDDTSSLHVLLLYSIHPEIGCTNILYRDEYTFTAQTSTFYENRAYQIIKLTTLRETAAKQVSQLKELYGKLTKYSHISDIDLDSDIDVDAGKTSEPILSSLKPPLVNNKRKTVPNSNKLLPEIPLRTPTTLPDTITFESISANRKRASTVTSGPLATSPQSPQTLPTNLSDESTNITDIDPNHGSICPSPTSPQSQNHVPNGRLATPKSPQSCHNPQPPIKVNNESQSSPQLQYNTDTNHPPSTSNGPVISVMPSTRPSTSSTQPQGHFKLISVSRYNNFLQRREPRLRAGVLRNFELMPNVSFISTYKG